ISKFNADAPLMLGAIETGCPLGAGALLKVIVDSVQLLSGTSYSDRLYPPRANETANFILTSITIPGLSRPSKSNIRNALLSYVPVPLPANRFGLSRFNEP